MFPDLLGDLSIDLFTNVERLSGTVSYGRFLRPWWWTGLAKLCGPRRQRRWRNYISKFRARGFDECAIDADDHMVGGILDGWFLCDLGSRFRFDRLSHRQDAIACRRVIETREIGQKFVQDIGGLLIGELAPADDP